MGRAAIHVDNRRDELLEAAARRFARGGFDATSMRDIAGDVGMLAGSMYYHFPSKDDLIAAVYALGVAQITDAVGAALARAAARPWERLEAACVAHLEALLDASPFARVMIVDLSRCAPALRRRLVASRDAYEAVFRGLVAALPAGAPSDRRLLRLQLLGSLNAVPGWYRPGGATPAGIARAFVAALRGG